MRLFKGFKSLNRCAEPALGAAEGFNPSPFFEVARDRPSSPAFAGEDQGGGLKDLNFLNGLNQGNWDV